MLSYNNSQDAEPLFDYYVETDLDDQPIDYSKRYADQDSYEDRRRKRANLNSSQCPTVETSQVVKPSTKNSHDEVKVFCMEGTPVTISSASSFCDLREIGATSSLSKAQGRQNLPSTNDDENPSDAFEDQKITETFQIEKEESPKGKKEITKEAKSLNLQESGDISKASSPMMFSRSSSVCSLNSFEQHSIVDDRSSISAISALTSGIISPSDLPDSPSELMCPDLTDKTSSSKINNPKKQNNVLLDTPGISFEVQLNVEDVTDKKELADHMPHCFLPSDRSEAISENDANHILEQQLDLLQDTSMELDEVFTNPELEKDAFVLKSERGSSDQLSVKSDEDSDAEDILLQQCIQLGMPSEQCGMNQEKHKDDQHENSSLLTISGNVSSKNMKYIGYENKDILQPSNGRQIEGLEFCGTSKPNSSVTANEKLPIMQVEMTNSEPNKSDVDSDEDDELLQQCIKMGMPSEMTEISSEQKMFAEPSHVSKPMTEIFSKDLPNTTAVRFDEDDDEDGDDILLQQCIQLGMSNKSVVNKIDPCIVTQKECHNVSSKSEKPLVYSRKDVYQANATLLQKHNLLAQHCMKSGIPPKLPAKLNGNSALIHGATYQNSVQNNIENVVKKQYPSKSDYDFDGDEEDILLQHCIKLGMPKESPEKKGVKSKVVKKPAYVLQQTTTTSSDLRDNCPDGTSDGDDEDDILANCIRAGMPNPKTVNDVHSRLLLSQNKTLPKKTPMPNSSSYLQIANIETNKKCVPRLPPNQPYAPVHASTTWLTNTSFIDVDSMRIYQTEDTPILSPSASISDLSSLSFNESFLNNSRNSNCSSESDDDELLRQCIRSGMPEPKKAAA